jgi:integrase
MKKLTDAYVRTVAAPKTGRIEVRDSETPGFALRVTENSAKSWVLIYYFNGRKTRLTLGAYPEMSLADARKHARERRSEVENGKDPAAEKRIAQAAQTMEETAEVYIERWAKPNKRTWAGDQWMLNKYVLPYWRDRKLREIQRADVIDLLERIAKDTPIQANRVRALLSKLFRFAISQALCDFNPVRDTVRLAKESPREFSLTPVQIRTIWKGIGELENERVRDFYKLAFLTCARRGELLGMTWAELDLDASIWSLPVERMKNGRAWRVPLPPTAVAVLRDRKARAVESPLVFANKEGESLKPGGLRFAHCAFTEAVGIPFRVHDIRGACVTQIAATMSAPPDVLDAILAHLSPSVTRRHYDRYTREPEHRRALLRWDNWLQGVAEPRGEVVQLPSVAVAS